MHAILEQVSSVFSNICHRHSILSREQHTIVDGRQIKGMLLHSGHPDLMQYLCKHFVMDNRK